MSVCPSTHIHVSVCPAGCGCVCASLWPWNSPCVHPCACTWLDGHLSVCPSTVHQRGRDCPCVQGHRPCPGVPLSMWPCCWGWVGAGDGLRCGRMDRWTQGHRCGWMQGWLDVQMDTRTPPAPRHNRPPHQVLPQRPHSNPISFRASVSIRTRSHPCFQLSVYPTQPPSPPLEPWKVVEGAQA